jgi:hypothetical protein
LRLHALKRSFQEPLAPEKTSNALQYQLNGGTVGSVFLDFAGEALGHLPLFLLLKLLLQKKNGKVTVIRALSFFCM